MRQGPASPAEKVTVKGGEASGLRPLAEPAPAPRPAPARVAPGAAAGSKHDGALDGPDARG